MLKRLKAGDHYVQIAITSVVLAIIVIGVSAILLRSLQENETSQSASSSSEKDHNHNGSATTTVEIVVIIGMVASMLQLIASVALWCTKERESKPQVLGFICGQLLIQIIHITCLGLVTYEYFKPSPTSHTSLLLDSSSPSLPPQSHNSLTEGHTFWIVLAVNIIFHLVAIIYLIFVLRKRTDYETDMQAVVIVHRRVPSRIPKSKRQGFKH